MRFGRRNKAAGADADTATDAGQEPDVADGAVSADVAEPAAPRADPPSRSRDLPEAGPFDVAEVDVEDGDWVDLGSLLLPPPEGMELRLQVDEPSGQVVSAVLVGSDGALELRAFAASRGGGAWEELRPRIAAEIERQGGTADEEDGTFGTELLCRVPVTGPDGESATQVSRFAGHEGPTWLLRTNLLGPPALEAEISGRWEDLVRSVVVQRGPGAMAPGSPLPISLPPEAKPVSQEP